MPAGLASSRAQVDRERNDMMEKEKRTVLYPPCDIGDKAYYVGQFDAELFIDEYTVKALMYDGEKWYTTDDYCTFNEIGTYEAILDEGAALARFRELRDEAINGGSDGST